MSPLAGISLFLLFLASPAPISINAASFQCDSADHQTLLKIKAEFGNPAALSSWDSSTDCCSSWDYVSCLSNGQVDGLSFTAANLSGTITPSFASLPVLSTLVFTNVSALTGPIPSSLANLTSLSTLTITGTSLTGPIPTSLATLSDLHSLDLSFNRLTGSIPDIFMAGTINLYLLDLSGNQLTGLIPPSMFLGSSSSVLNPSPILYLSHNKLTGPIPPAFVNVNFAIVDLSHNRLTGDASFLFGSDKTTTAIDLSWNELEFDMSAVKFANGLAQLDVSHNRIRGSIPKAISGLKNLNELDVSYNQLCGRIPHRGQNVGVFNSSSYVGNKCLCGAPLPRCGA